MTARQIARIYGSPLPKYRPEWVETLGKRLLPESVTDAWYRAQCPPSFNPRGFGVSQLNYVTWKLSCWLRGCRKKAA